MRALVPALLVAPLLAAAALAVPPAAHAPCADAVEPVLFAHPSGALENLAFDGEGRLYLSDLGEDRLLVAAPDGNVSLVAQVPGMHGLVFGPDGKLYAGASEGGAAAVWRYASLDPPVRETVMTGLRAANGMAFGADGDLFVSSPLSEQGPYLVRAPAANLSAWAPWGDTYGTNGLVLDADGSLVSVVTGDQSSPVVRLSTTDPGDVEVIARLSFGAGTLQPGVHAPGGDPYLVPKGLDDLTIGADGYVYAAAHVTGELLRVDPATGAACAYADGFLEPTSVRAAHGFGAWDGWLFVTDMGGAAVSGFLVKGDGRVWAVPPPALGHA